MSQKEKKYKARKRARVKARRKSNRMKTKLYLKLGDYDSIKELVVKRINNFYVSITER